MSQTAKWTASHTHVIGWCIVCVGWFASSYLGYRFGARRYAQERAEAVFEEVSVLIEKANFITCELERLLDAKQPPQTRIDLWHDFLGLQRTYAGDRSRLQFLMNKYFGSEIASKVDFVISGLLGDSDIQDYTEEQGQMSRNYVEYFECWTGQFSEDATDKWSGYKWKMMAKCGMDVRPFIVDLRKKHKERLQQSSEGVR